MDLISWYFNSDKVADTRKIAATIIVAVILAVVAMVQAGGIRAILARIRTARYQAFRDAAGIQDLADLELSTVLEQAEQILSRLESIETLAKNTLSEEDRSRIDNIRTTIVRRLIERLGSRRQE